ncbi:MAG: hypothetical protein K2P51_02525 [Rhabdochlamydiaceae bacterium]|nr:hypothetical protein [Rhabdochlamydiaceae bacterium]
MDIGTIKAALTTVQVDGVKFEESKLNENVNALKYSSGWNVFFGLGAILNFFASRTDAYKEAEKKDADYESKALASKASVEQFDKALNDVVDAKFRQITCVQLKDESPSQFALAQQTAAQQVEAADEKVAVALVQRFSVIHPDAAKLKSEDGAVPAVVAFETFKAAVKQLIAERYNARVQKELTPAQKQPTVNQIYTEVEAKLPLAIASEAVKTAENLETVKGKKEIEKTVQTLCPKTANVSKVVAEAIKTFKSETLIAVKEAVNASPKPSDLGADQIKAHRETLTEARTKYEGKIKDLDESVTEAQNGVNAIVKGLQKKDGEFRTANKAARRAHKPALSEAFFGVAAGGTYVKPTLAQLALRYGKALSSSSKLSSTLVNSHTQMHMILAIELKAAQDKLAELNAKKAKVQGKLDKIPSEKLLREDSIVKLSLIKKLNDEKAEAEAYAKSLKK